MSKKDREAHPGWSVRFVDNSWLCTNMMCAAVEDAFYATRYDSAEIAETEVKQAIKESPKSFPTEYDIIEAWQPLCESLRVSIHSLEEACSISPSDLDDITWNLESVLNDLKASIKKK